MPVEYQFELKKAKMPTLLIKGSTTNETQAIQNYQAAVELWEGAAPPPVASAPKNVATPAEGENAEAKPVVNNGVSKTSNAKKFTQDLNNAALVLLERASIVIADFRGQHPLDIANTLGFKQELATMTASDLQSVINQTRDALSIYANNHTAAAAYLNMADLLDSATTSEELEANKDSFKRGRDLSADAFLFNEAKALYERRKASLQAADLAVAS